MSKKEKQRLRVLKNDSLLKYFEANFILKINLWTQLRYTPTFENRVFICLLNKRTEEANLKRNLSVNYCDFISGSNGSHSFSI